VRRRLIEARGGAKTRKAKEKNVEALGKVTNLDDTTARAGAANDLLDGGEGADGLLVLDVLDDLLLLRLLGSLWTK
jgi:hypothetical protein